MARLRARLTARVGPEGAIRDRCRSRVLESALAWKLLDGADADTGQARERLEHYLRGRWNGGDALEQVMVAAVLGGDAELPKTLLQRTLERAPSFTEARKRTFLQALMIVLTGDARPVGEYRPERAAFALKGLHPWAAVQVTAVKVVLAVAAGRRDLVEPGDVARLTATQRGPRTWEGNVLIHLWVLHALRRLTGWEEFRGLEQLVATGTARVLEHQRHDGGLPFVTDVDTWCTATGGVALAAAGAPQVLLRRVGGHLARRQLLDGGWSFTDHAAVTDVDDTAVALQFLQTCGVTAPSRVVELGWQTLARVRGTDGGYPTYVSGAPSEASMTAAALDALTPQPHRHVEALRTGLRFLVGQQQADGSFPPDWSASRWHTVFRVVLVATRPGLPRVPGAGRMVERAVRLALDAQNADGGWGQQEGDPSDPLSTAYGLITVCAQDGPQPATAAAQYLLSLQQPNGTLPSAPDSIGPRPLVFNVPLLTDIFALQALAHLACRFPPPDRARPDAPRAVINPPRYDGAPALPGGRP
ncbi:prenyltransferase/squalene oxidase repeat-containing protein [Actinomadura hibisca]|uniref:prenyltransferase/squalene oxidase repeat-containing protein n=1 Tax=Actinomadura hibisca TaxID=68565 RepID=UPI0008303E67|nr:prenyltransferase/squalene oxidase repeat-containing protein [Actinomadura hibisca]